MVYAKDNGAGTYLNVHSGLSIYGKDIYADENDARCDLIYMNMRCS